MDLTECGPLLATDLIITPFPVYASDVCAANYLPWILVLVACFFVNIWVAVQRTKLHRKRPGRRAMPWIVILSYISSLVVLLYLVLPFFGVNAANGGTAILLELEYLTFDIKGLLMLRKLVKLGRRIIPVSHKVHLDDGSSFHTSESDSRELNASRLSSVDRVLKILFVLGWITMTAQVWFLTVMIYAKRELTPVWFTVAFAIQDFHLAVVVVSITYQLQRCIAAIQRTYTGTSAAPNTEQSSVLLRAASKLRAQQMIVCFLAVPALIGYTLLVVDIMPRHYGVVVAMMLTSDAVTNFCLLVSMTKRTKVPVIVDTGRITLIVVPDKEETAVPLSDDVPAVVDSQLQ